LLRFFFYYRVFDVPNVDEAEKEPWRFPKGVNINPGIDLLALVSWEGPDEEYLSNGFIEGIAVRQANSENYRRVGYWGTVWNTRDSVFDCELVGKRQEIVLE
jgi:hypothetical protein